MTPSQEQANKDYIREVNDFFAAGAGIEDEISFVYGNNIHNITLTREFDRAIQIIEETNETTFITGKAGTGKSTLLKYFRAKTKKNVAVLSFTGLAAINVEGQTIHSFFQLPVGYISPNRVKRNETIIPVLRTVQTIVIDEISMARADLIDGIDKSLRVHRDSNEPFGGVQMIFIGDLYQLPPVLETELEAMYSNYYRSPYFFHASVFKGMHHPLIYLQRIHRQTNPEFIEILNNVRERKNLHQTLSKLNARVVKDVKGLRESETIVLCTTNVKAQQINDFFLTKLTTKIFTYKADLKGDFDEKSYPTNSSLELKEGAKVIFIKNDNPNKRFVNGDIGIVRRLDHGLIEVETKGKLIQLDKEVWNKIKYRKTVQKDANGEVIPNSEKLEKIIVGSFSQYPLKLAWAITIHKSQGQTYNDVLIDMDRGAFTSGQTYVALSRCRTLDGIKLKRPINERDVIVDEMVEEFKNVFVDIDE